MLQVQLVRKPLGVDHKIAEFRLDIGAVTFTPIEQFRERRFAQFRC